MTVRPYTTVAVLAVLPVVLAGCAVLAPPTPTADPSLPGPGKTGFLYQSGSRTPEAPQPAAASTPSATASAPVTVTVSAQPASGGFCPGRLYEGKMDTLSVTPGSGTALVGWQNAGGSEVTSYRVAAESQTLYGGEQSPVPWVSTPPPSACGLVTTSITGLHHGEYYVFWLDAVATDIRGGSKDTMIGRSPAVLIP